MGLERFSIRCCSDFNLYNRWFSGEDITPVLEQRQALGFNSCRVWTAFDIPLIGTCDPHRPDFYAKWPEFMDLLDGYELYAEVTAFTGPYPYFPTQQSMIDHWNALEAAVAPCVNLLDLEAINEYDNAPNAGVPLDRLGQPACLSSHGSAVQDAPPKEPHWSVAGYRSPSSEWQRKVGHNAMEWAANWAIPVWTNEFPRTDNDPNLDCAQAFISGALSVPLEFQAGAYTQNNPPYPPGVIRIYQRTLSDGRFYQVPVRG